MAVLEHDSFSNISWTSDHPGHPSSDAATSTNYDNDYNYDYTQHATGSSAHGPGPAMADYEYGPSSASDEARATPTGADTAQPKKNKGKQRQTAVSDSLAHGTRPSIDAIDYESHDAGALGPEILQCRVSSPLTENEGGSNPFTSYLVTTHSTFPSFQKPTVSVRRRFTDFLFLFNSLSKDYPACAVPPVPDKQRMVRVTGDRFGPDFTSRRAFSLQRFLARCALHPVLRRAPLLHNFLESGEWNATMRSHAVRHAPDGGYTSGGHGSGGAGADGGNGNGNGNGGVAGSMFDAFADSFINAFTKVHRTDRRFVEVRERSDRLDDDVTHVEKVVARVVRREADIETDLRDLAEQFQKLIVLEPGVEAAVRAFAASVEDTATGLRGLREATDQDYLGSLRDMVAYSGALKGLLKAREQKQLDYEQLTEYLNKSTAERDQLATSAGGYYHSSLTASGGGRLRRDSATSGGESSASASAGGTGTVSAVSGYVATGGSGALAGASGFLRSKLEDVRGVDHEQSRRERQRKLELRVEELTAEVERAKKTSALFDDEVVKEVADFERIKRIEFKRQLGGLAESHMAYYDAVADVWEAYVKEMEKDGVLAV